VRCYDVLREINPDGGVRHNHGTPSPAAGVPITNYGAAIAAMNGTLERCTAML